MAKTNEVVKISAMYYFFTLKEWKIYEVDEDVYHTTRFLQVPPSSSVDFDNWVNPAVRKEIEQWIL